MVAALSHTPFGRLNFLDFLQERPVPSKVKVWILLDCSQKSSLFQSMKVQMK